MRYDPELVQPMRDELTRLGVQELHTPEEVEEALGTWEGTTLLVINSVCGCAAANARPALAIARGSPAQPDTLVTVFAGQDIEATDKAREYLPGFQPSSPFMALFAEGELVFVLERHHIEGREATEIARDITDAFARFCGASPVPAGRTFEREAKALVQQEVGPRDPVSDAEQAQITQFENEGGASL
jgi:putative YphP/YqiW family bacilliredoxin